ncbi:MAG TPA: hypothetical protein VGR19_05440 [Allosphingosinicella sp.]|nr:hypothetical protein [Allosphingosinicella sp.]
MLNGWGSALLLPFALLAACGESPPPPPAKVEKAQAPRQAAAPAPAPAESAALSDESTKPSEPGAAQAAATVLQTYYALIQEGKYREAWKLRSPERGGDEAAFLDSFTRYASYRADVGDPSQPAAADGWLYVEVPVQIYVRTKSGEASSSAGSVTLRRREKGSAAERQWRIYS